MGPLVGMVVFAIMWHLGVGHLPKEAEVTFAKVGALIGFLLLPVGLSLLKLLRICDTVMHKKIKDKKIKDKVCEQLSSYQIKLYGDPIFFLTEAQAYFQEMTSSFRDRLFGLEAKFKAATIEPRERAGQAIAELSADCKRLESASDTEIADREFLLKMARERLEEFKQMADSINPQEGALLNMFHKACAELEELNKKIAAISDEKRRYESAKEIEVRLEKYDATTEKLNDIRETRLRDIEFYLANLLKYIRAADKLLGEVCGILPSISVIEVEKAELPPDKAETTGTKGTAENLLPLITENSDASIMALESQVLSQASRRPGLSLADN